MKKIILITCLLFTTQLFSQTIETTNKIKTTASDSIKSPKIKEKIDNKKDSTYNLTSHNLLKEKLKMKLKLKSQLKSQLESQLESQKDNKDTINNNIKNSTNNEEVNSEKTNSNNNNIVSKNTSPSNDEVTDVPFYMNRIGVEISTLSGFGINYQYSPIKSFSIKVSGSFSVYSKKEYDEDITYVNENNSEYGSNLMLEYSIFRTNLSYNKNLRTYIGIGGNWLTKKETKETYDINTQLTIRSTDNINKTLMSGTLSLGIEFFINRLSLDVNTGYCYETTKNKNLYNSDNDKFINEDIEETKPFINVSSNINF